MRISDWSSDVCSSDLAELVERAVPRKRQRGVERRLPAHGRKHGVGAFLLNDLRDDFGRDRLHIGRVRQLRIGHDRRRIGIDEDDAIALLVQRLARLRARIRSEEHTSELQSLMRISYAVFCLKKKKTNHHKIMYS